MDKAFFMYKVWVTGEKEFYIGVTSNPVSRKSQHFSAIYSLLRPLKLSQNVSHRNQAHVFMAKRLLRRQSILSITPELKSRLNFKVIGVATSCEEITKLESETLRLYAGDPLCLNIRKYA